MIFGNFKIFFRKFIQFFAEGIAVGISKNRRRNCNRFSVDIITVRRVPYRRRSKGERLISKQQFQQKTLLRKNRPQVTGKIFSFSVTKRTSAARPGRLLFIKHRNSASRAQINLRRKTVVFWDRIFCLQ